MNRKILIIGAALANRQKCAGIPIVHMLSNSTRRAIVQPQK